MKNTTELLEAYKDLWAKLENKEIEQKSANTFVRLGAQMVKTAVATQNHAAYLGFVKPVEFLVIPDEN